MLVRMPKFSCAPINGEIVRWAIALRNLDYTSVAKRVGATVEQLKSWEGDIHPPLGKARKLATSLRVPFGYLFLANAPSDDIPLPDLRTRSDTLLGRPSPELIDSINDAMRKQAWYRDVAERGRVELSGKHTIEDSPLKVAESIRESLGIDEKLRASVTSWSSYLTTLSRCAESAGILVMRTGTVRGNTSRTLSEKEFQGFALYDPYAPVVFINGRDAYTAMIFTLAHEIAHIAIGENAITDVTDDAAQVSGEIETFCHSVATEVLVPIHEFTAVWRKGFSAERQLLHMARHFWVSTIVILRRALDHQFIGRSEFFELVEQERKKLKKRKGSGGDPYLNAQNRNSLPFVDAVIRELRHDRIIYGDALRLLDLTPKMFDGLTERRTL